MGYVVPFGLRGTVLPSDALPVPTDFAGSLLIRPALIPGEGLPSSRVRRPLIPLPIPRRVLQRCISRRFALSVAFVVSYPTRLPLVPLRG